MCGEGWQSRHIWKFLLRKDPLLHRFGTGLHWNIILMLVVLPCFSAMVTQSLRKATATNLTGAPFLTPQDLWQDLSLVPFILGSCKFIGEEQIRAALSHLPWQWKVAATFLVMQKAHNYLAPGCLGRAENLNRGIQLSKLSTEHYFWVQVQKLMANAVQQILVVLAWFEVLASISIWNWAWKELGPSGRSSQQWKAGCVTKSWANVDCWDGS